jgi:hypothetical protein
MDRFFATGDPAQLCTATETILKSLATTDLRWPSGLNEAGFKAALTGALLPALPTGWSLRSEVKAGNGFVDVVVCAPECRTAATAPNSQALAAISASAETATMTKTGCETGPTVTQIAIELKYVPPGWVGSTEKKTTAALSSCGAIERQCQYLNTLKAAELERLFVTTAKTVCKVSTLCDDALRQSTTNANRLARSTNRATVAIALVGIGQRVLSRCAHIQ